MLWLNLDFEVCDCVFYVCVRAHEQALMDFHSISCFSPEALSGVLLTNLQQAVRHLDSSLELCAHGQLAEERLQKNVAYVCENSREVDGQPALSSLFAKTDEFQAKIKERIVAVTALTPELKQAWLTASVSQFECRH